MARKRTRSRHQRASLMRNPARMPGVYFDERVGRICITANATTAELRGLAELLGKPPDEFIRIKEKLDAAARPVVVS